MLNLTTKKESECGSKESTPIGSTVVLCGPGRLHILNSDGKLVKMINLGEENNLQYQRLQTSVVFALKTIENLQFYVMRLNYILYTFLFLYN